MVSTSLSERLIVFAHVFVAGAPQIVTTSQGTLVASFMTDEDATQTGWPDVGASFKIMTNTPGGEWGHKTEVSGIQSSWPGLFAKDDGTVYLRFLPFFADCTQD